MKKTIERKTNDGKSVTIIIDMGKSVGDNIAYADGDNINLGRKIIDTLVIEVYVEGKIRMYDRSEPLPVLDRQLLASGRYARLGDAYITEGAYKQIMSAIAELEAKIETSPEYKELKKRLVAAKIAAKKREVEEEAHYKKQLKNGLCPRCGTYCCGDCRA